MTSSLEAEVATESHLGIGHASDDRGHPVAGSRIEDLGYGENGVLPVAGLQVSVVVLHHGEGEPLALEAIAGEPGLVREPLLVDVLVGARKNAEDLNKKETTTSGSVRFHGQDQKVSNRRFQTTESKKFVAHKNTLPLTRSRKKHKSLK